MRIIGLTGGIASGKSTVSGMLEQLGATVLDADGIYHALIAPIAGEPSPLARRIDERFGNVLGPDGAIDRKALGQRAFGDREALRSLGSITHPAVAAELALRIEKLAEEGLRGVVYDVPLLFERRLEGGMDGVIVVWVPRAVQLRRLIERDGLSEEEANRRVDSQLPLDDKRARARWVVDNSGSLETTRSQVDGIWPDLGLAEVG